MGKIVISKEVLVGWTSTIQVRSRGGGYGLLIVISNKNIHNIKINYSNDYNTKHVLQNEVLDTIKKNYKNVKMLLPLNNVISNIIKLLISDISALSGFTLTLAMFLIRERHWKRSVIHIDVDLSIPSAARVLFQFDS